jgi:hypothetical protein
MTQEIIYDPIRKQHVAATPEEIVRQQVLDTLSQMGYPFSLIAVEKKLSEICKQSHVKIPLRRIDIVCFSKKDHKPLLMIECKASKITQKAILQVMGYNRFVQAPFISLCSNKQTLMAFWNSALGEYTFLEHFLTYDELINAL